VILYVVCVIIAINYVLGLTVNLIDDKPSAFKTIKKVTTEWAQPVFLLCDTLIIFFAFIRITYLFKRQQKDPESPLKDRKLEVG